MAVFAHFLVVVVVVVVEGKTLEEVARKEFGLGNVEIEFSSSCVNLCNGIPARISESVWEHTRPYIGCISVAVRGLLSSSQPAEEAPVEKRQAVSSSPKVGPAPPSTETKLAAHANNEDDGDHPELGHHDRQSNALVEEVTEQEDDSGDRRNDDVAAREDYSHEEPEEAWEEEVSAVLPPKSRRRHRVASEDEDEGEDSDKELEAPPNPKFKKPRQDQTSDTERQPSGIKSPVLLVPSPPKPLRPLSREIKKERDAVDHRSQADLQSAECSRLQSRPIKQEKRDNEPRSSTFSHEGNSQPTHTQSQSQSLTPTQSEPSNNQRLMVRVAHRASKQESKFTTKGSTKVAKVIAGACKSFGLDASRYIN
ncbi:hypothetical protein BS17DRAFT_818738 [Gyrodon lividus]|nr:hypothetical protein BS17DRAFT_818738 [Gyrodon lividus]